MTSGSLSSFASLSRVKWLMLLGCLFSSLVLGAEDLSSMDDEADFSPMLSVFFLAAVVGMFVLVGIGVVLGAFVLASIAILTALGVITSSTVIALYRRRFSTGLRSLHYQVCAVASSPAGVGVLWLIDRFSSLALSWREMIVLGSGVGIGTGLFFAWILDRCFKLIYRRCVQGCTTSTFPTSPHRN